LSRHVLDSLRVHPLAELSVLLVDVAAMTDLHERWLDEPGPTDVLAFPMDELRPPSHGGGQPDRTPDDASGQALLGDVVLCPEVALQQAGEAGHDVADELDLLCTHGILHLLGYDHAEPDEKATMFGLQDRLLGTWRADRGPAAGPHGDGQDSAGQDSAGQDGTAGQDAPGEHTDSQQAAGTNGTRADAPLPADSLDGRQARDGAEAAPGE
jgi:probable rRNA maturation factor